MADHNEILEAANDIIKNVTPGNPNAMTASNKAIALALISIAQDVHAMRGDMDEMRKMTRTLDEIRGRLNFRRWQDASPRWIYNWQLMWMKFIEGILMIIPNQWNQREDFNNNQIRFIKMPNDLLRLLVFSTFVNTDINLKWSLHWINLIHFNSLLDQSQMIRGMIVWRDLQWFLPDWS